MDFETALGWLVKASVVGVIALVIIAFLIGRALG